MTAEDLAALEGEAAQSLTDIELLARARRDAEWHMKLEIKSPEDLAAQLPLPIARALSRIYQNGQLGWQCRNGDAPALREYGLVEARGRGVGAYGLKVYRALRAKYRL